MAHRIPPPRLRHFHHDMKHNVSHKFHAQDGDFALQGAKSPIRAKSWQMTDNEVPFCNMIRFMMLRFFTVADVLCEVVIFEESRTYALGRGFSEAMLCADCRQSP